MKRINDLQHDLKDVSDNVLGNLSTEERIRMYLKAAAEDQDERIEWLRDTAPRKEYTMRDLEFTEGAKEVYMLSMLANDQLERLYTAMMMHEAGRDKMVALVLLNEALEQLSQGHFTADEYGDVDAPDSWPHDYGPVYDPDTSRLAAKYRELWERNDLELAFDPEDRSRPYFAEIAGGSSDGYRNDVTENFSPPGVAMAEDKLMQTVVGFYECFHTWRRLAEEHLDVTVAELLRATQLERQPFDTYTAPGWLDEEQCREMLSGMNLYIEAYEEQMERIGEVLAAVEPEKTSEVDDDRLAEFGEEFSEIALDARVEANVEEMAAELNYTC